MLWIAVNIAPSLTPAIESFVFDKQYGMQETYGIEGGSSETVQGSVEGLNMDCLFSQFVDEWALPLTEGPKVLYQLRDKILEAAKNKEFYVHAPIEVRCSNLTTSGSTEEINPDDYKSTKEGQCGAIPGNNLSPYLNPAPPRPYAPCVEGKVSNENLTLYINATMYRPFGWNSPIDKWFRFFEDTEGTVGAVYQMVLTMPPKTVRCVVSRPRLRDSLARTLMSGSASARSMILRASSLLAKSGPLSTVSCNCIPSTIILGCTQWLYLFFFFLLFS